jgi:hypothetical protein
MTRLGSGPCARLQYHVLLGVYCHWRRPAVMRSAQGSLLPECPVPHSQSLLTPSPIIHVASQALPQSPALLMSHTMATAVASSRFQAIFQAALKSYQKQTKKDLLTHPLSSQLQMCESTTAILAILQEKVREFDKSSGDERLIKWLGPTVNVLNAFSATAFGGASLVSLNTWASKRLQSFSDVYLVGIFTCECNLRRDWCFPFGEWLPISLRRSTSHQRCYRRPRVSQRVKMFSRSSSSAWGGFLRDSKRTQRWPRLRR